MGTWKTTETAGMVPLEEGALAACISLRPYCWVVPLAVEAVSEVTLFSVVNVRMLTLPVPTMIWNTCRDPELGEHNTSTDLDVCCS